MPEGTPSRRRQERGRARIDQILLAAAAVFGELGYEATTTNAIAARAEISPGSLYQFFGNKEAVAHALAERYATELASLDAIGAVSPDTDVTEAVRNAIGPIIAFNLLHPGFKALFARTDMPPAMRAAVAPVQEEMHGRVADAIAALVPALPAERLGVTVTVVLHTVQGLMPAIVAAPEGESRQALSDELCRSLVAYLTAVARDASAETG